MCVSSLVLHKSSRIPNLELNYTLNNKRAAEHSSEIKCDVIYQFPHKNPSLKN